MFFGSTKHFCWGSARSKAMFLGQKPIFVGGPRGQKPILLEIRAVKSYVFGSKTNFVGGPHGQKAICLEIRAVKSYVFWSKTNLFGGPRGQNHIFQPNLAIHKFIYCVYICNTQPYFSGIRVLVSPRLAHTRAANIHITPHTKGK